MSSELLRRAAALMRDRAEAASASAPSPWFVSEFEIVTDDQEPIETLSVLTSALHWRDAAAQRAHVASWHPDVALAVADWLDRLYEFITSDEFDPDAELLAALYGDEDACPLSDWPEVHSAVTVARAYLGEFA